MSGINKIILIGHVVQEPTARFFPDKTEKLTFSLVTTQNEKKAGKIIGEAEYHTIVIMQKLDLVAPKLLVRGTLVYVEGEVRHRSFVDEAGAKQYVTEIITDSFTLLGRASDF